MAPESAGEPLSEETIYATAIEEVFIAERGTPFLLSPKDWLLIRTWRENGIPVDSVVRAIRETFERRRQRGDAGKISSVAYCANAVEERWELERRGLVGQGGSRPDATPEAVGPRLSGLAATLRKATGSEPTGLDPATFQKVLGRAASRIDELDPEKGFDDLEEALTAIEKTLLGALAKALDEPTRAEVERQVGDALGDTAGISTEVRDRTRRALRRRQIRRSLGLPSLTLFDV